MVANPWLAPEPPLLYGDGHYLFWVCLSTLVNQPLYLKYYQISIYRSIYFFICLHIRVPNLYVLSLSLYIYIYTCITYINIDISYFYIFLNLCTYITYIYIYIPILIFHLHIYIYTYIHIHIYIYISCTCIWIYRIPKIHLTKTPCVPGWSLDLSGQSQARGWVALDACRATAIYGCTADLADPVGKWLVYSRGNG